MLRCPNCGNENPQGYLICYFCHELLTPRPNKIYGVDTRPDIDLNEAKQGSNYFEKSQYSNFATSSPTRQVKKEQESSKETAPKSQKIKQQKTKAAKSKRPKKSKSPKKVKQKKQKGVRSPRKQIKEVHTVKKRGGFLAAFLALILLAIAAVAIAGALLIHHYGLQTILNHFGYQLTSVEQDETSSQETSESRSTQQETESTVDKNEESSSEPEVSSDLEESQTTE